MPSIQKFFDTHATKRTYYFQLRKCTDNQCEFHGEIRGTEEIKIFPDPEPYEKDGVQHYRPGSDADEKFLPSKLHNAEKRPHNIPFSPTAQTAKNVGLTIKCTECEKPRLLHSKHKLKGDEIKVLKIFLGKILFICGSSFGEYEGTGNAKEDKITKIVFPRENLSCGSNIELPYYSIESYKKICIYCGGEGTGRTLEDSIQNYPKCRLCECKQDIPRRKRKAMTEGDLNSKKKKN